MILNIHMAKPGGQTRLLRTRIKIPPFNHIKRLHNIIHKDVHMRVHGTSKHLPKHQSSDPPPRPAPYTESGTQDLHQPSSCHASRSPNAIKDAPAHQTRRQGRELPPTPTIQAASKQSYASQLQKVQTNAEHRPHVEMSINRQLSIEFLQADFPLTRAAKVEKPSSTEFLVNVGSARTPDPSGIRLGSHCKKGAGGTKSGLNHE